MAEPNTLKADSNVLLMWTKRNKCWMCKHKFSQPVVLPVDKVVPSKLQPNINKDVLFHLFDTHGIPADAVAKMIVNSVYGIENTMKSVYGETL